ncbi:class I SAM-dependent methyltransferase [Sphingobium lignivorans]|uniref:SAM-dependent methyltransferase n=1 Tax=Sphingobium lignivorans TaxID=2735886 RepID=A0ABR6NGU5_9SPHN|nr:class I SAM-dependent methyltransferase [Sphingobium lignivorans]MBB5986508.1 SAM-dependent methyltransferase [Sphingobium lignivorans]
MIQPGARTASADRGPNIEATARFGAQVDFGRTASDYGTFRAGFPEAFFDRLAGTGAFSGVATILDVGTGTGTLARGFARRGMRVTGLDPAPALLDEAARLDRETGVTVDYRQGTAESLPFPDAAFDMVTAGQCWHWFDRAQAAAETFRVLRPGGFMVIAHFDWLPLRGSVVEATEGLILEANPAWTMGGGTGIYPQWPGDLADAGFTDIETCSFDVTQPYSHDGWCGRIRASAGVRASLDPAATDRFEEGLRALLAADFSAEPLLVPHRVWWASGRKPG